MQRAFLFDFNGVLVDDEHVHWRAWQEVLARLGHDLREDTYFTRYLGLDDRGILGRFASDQGWALEDGEPARLVAEKATIYTVFARTELRAVPGAAAFVRAAAALCPVGLVSGALRPEIDVGLAFLGLEGVFQAIVSAEEVRAGKPAPEGYLLGLSRLRMTGGALLQAGGTVAIEDAPHGIAAAHAAGLRAVGLPGGRSESALAMADLVVPTLEGLDPEEVLSALEPITRP